LAGFSWGSNGTCSFLFAAQSASTFVSQTTTPCLEYLTSLLLVGFLVLGPPERCWTPHLSVKVHPSFAPLPSALYCLPD
jgi:hypothetical protein